MEHPGVVAWLKRVYMVGDPSSSTAKSAVYDKYVRYCDRNGLTPTSAAAFGKLVHKGKCPSSAVPSLPSSRCSFPSFLLFLAYIRSATI